MSRFIGHSMCRILKNRFSVIFDTSTIKSCSKVNNLQISLTIGQLQNAVRHFAHDARHAQNENVPNNEENRLTDCYDYNENNFEQFGSVLKRDMAVFADFISTSEEEALFAEIEPYLKKMKYERDHWDNAIEGYRETEKKHWFQANKEVITRIQKKAFTSDLVLLPHVHVLDLEQSGWIKPHVDSTRFCGPIIAGISLMSDSVMRLVLEKNQSVYADVLLPRRSLYIMRDTIRFDFSHAILAPQESIFKGRPVTKNRRISIICRCQPKD